MVPCLDVFCVAIQMIDTFQKLNPIPKSEGDTFSTTWSPDVRIQVGVFESPCVLVSLGVFMVTKTLFLTKLKPKP